MKDNTTLSMDIGFKKLMMIALKNHGKLDQCGGFYGGYCMNQYQRSAMLLGGYLTLVFMGLCYEGVLFEQRQMALCNNKEFKGVINDLSRIRSGIRSVKKRY